MTSIALQFLLGYFMAISGWPTRNSENRWSFSILFWGGVILLLLTLLNVDLAGELVGLLRK